MIFIRSVLQRIHIFCLGFAISAACLLSAGMIAGYQPEAEFAAGSIDEEWTINP